MAETSRPSTTIADGYAVVGEALELGAVVHDARSIPQRTYGYHWQP